MEENLYEFEKRSIRVDRKDTTVSMERMYWKAMEKLARKTRRTWRYVAWLALMHKPHAYKSRAGWLRLYVTGYAYAFLTRSSKRHIHPVLHADWAWFQKLARRDA